MPTLELGSGALSFECRCENRITLAPPHHQVQVHSTEEVTVTPWFMCHYCGRVGQISRADLNADDFTEAVRWKGGFSSSHSGNVAVPADPRIEPAITLDKRDSSAPETEEGAADTQNPTPRATTCGAPLVSGGTCEREVANEGESCWQHQEYPEMEEEE